MTYAAFVRRWVLLTLLLVVALAASPGCNAGSDEDESGRSQSEESGREDRPAGAAVERLRRGGYVVALRHAATDPTATD
ncbi:MAG TPA: hypothetical protein VFB44_02915, partial [Thermoleophilaceae bacterium]|nr:hypothetical protein [Thermoleophilaceae bacterium]